MIDELSKMNSYTLEVRCENCGQEQVIVIPKGREFSNHSYFMGTKAKIGNGYESEFPKCEKCGCGTLTRH